MKGLAALVVAAATVLLAAPAGAYGPTRDTAGALIPALYKNCTALNHKYSHGLGKATARDHVRGDSEPVTTFKRSTRLYNIAMSYNKGLDRDKDGIACEER
jgi:hypothetical protein